MNGEKLNQNLKNFLIKVDSIKSSLVMSILLIKPYNQKSIESFYNYLKKNKKNIERRNDGARISIKAENLKYFKELEKNASISILALEIIPTSMFMSLIAQYDFFLNKLVRIVFEIKPEIIDSSDKNLTFSEIVKKSSIKEVKENVVDMEIDSLLRKSHSEQFDYLESKLNIKLRENLPIWKTFVEITERRNLLVHCGGIVSDSYIKNCNKQKCELLSTKLGDKLKITPEYFSIACNCLYEISAKLTHTIWRKLLISDLKEADKELNHFCYDLIEREIYELADTMLFFAISQKKIFDDVSKNIYIINRGLSKYLQGKKNETKEIIDKDWSASSKEFKLAKAILFDDYKEAYKIMEEIGSKGEVNNLDYREWPLFLEIRKESKFKKIYKKIFKKDYKIVETPMKPAQEIIKK